MHRDADRVAGVLASLLGSATWAVVGPVLRAALVVLLAGAAGSAGAETADPSPGLRLHRDLPRDPLMVLGLWLDDPGRDLDPILLLGGPLIGAGPVATVPGAPDRPEADPLSAVRAEVLSSLGSEVVLWIDLRSIDDATVAFRVSPARGLSTLLARVGLVAAVRDAARFHHAMQTLGGVLGRPLTESDGLTRVGIPLSSAPAGDPTPPSAPQLELFYKVHDGRLVLGFSREWVAEALAPRPAGQRLVDGEDWGAVFGELDEKPHDLVYINLPRLRRQIEASELVQVLLRSNPDVRAVAERFLTPEGMSLGVGSTSVRTAKGVLTRNFGPPWMSGAAMSTGAIMALAAPQVMLAVDRGRARRSALDVQAIARACDSFSSRARTYPGPTAGWVPVERIAVQLEPVYISQLPRTDAWANPILYWSDGESYRVLSTGKDGRMDQDWSAVHEPTAPGGLEGDIVFGDGVQLAAPSALALPLQNQKK